MGSPLRARERAKSGVSGSSPCPTPTRGDADIRLVLLLDNYDSFTWNLRQLLASVAPSDARIVVVTNDDRSVEALLAARPWRVVISPGPGDPSRAGVSNELLRRVEVPTLGVCLGHQCLAHAFGGRVVRGVEPVHGKASVISHDGLGVFQGLPSPLRVARYHSLVVEETSLPSCLEISARSLDGVVMGLRHKSRPLAGLQFHPESVLSEHGAALAGNLLAGRV